MNTIDEVLKHYDLTLAECDDDWADMVIEFRNVKSAMPSHIAVQREKEIAECFLDYHDIKEENTAPVQTPGKKAPAASTGKKAGKGSAAKPKPYVFDEKAMLDKADKQLEDM